MPASLSLTTFCSLSRKPRVNTLAYKEKHNVDTRTGVCFPDQTLYKFHLK